MRGRKNGFTLLELMTVMVIMFILMGMATLALRGVVRGAGISGAVSNTKAVLTQGRQYAIMNQRATGVIFQQIGETNAMVIVSRYGRVVGSQQPGELWLEEELPWTEDDLKGQTLYNLTTGTKGVVVGNSQNRARFRMSAVGGWTAGHDIGFAVGVERYLPGGIEFTGVPLPIVFNADGSLRAAAAMQVRLREKYVSNPVVTVLQVDPSTGWVREQ